MENFVVVHFYFRLEKCTRTDTLGKKYISLFSVEKTSDRVEMRNRLWSRDPRTKSQSTSRINE